MSICDIYFMVHCFYLISDKVYIREFYWYSLIQFSYPLILLECNGASFLMVFLEETIFFFQSHFNQVLGIVSMNTIQGCKVFSASHLKPFSLWWQGNSRDFIFCLAMSEYKPSTGGVWVIMPPTLKKWGAYCFRLVCVCVHSSVQKTFKLGFGNFIYGFLVQK